MTFVPWPTAGIRAKVVPMGDLRPGVVLANRIRELLRELIDANVVHQPRYRVWERRHVRSAARVGAAVLIVVLLFDAAAMSSFAPAITALNLPLAAIGAALLLVTRRRSGPRRNPTGAAILIGSTALASSLLPLGLVPEAGTIQIAYVPIVIVASALFIPWNTVRHASWLAVCLGMVFGFVVSPFAARLGDAAIGERRRGAIGSRIVGESDEQGRRMASRGRHRDVRIQGQRAQPCDGGPRRPGVRRGRRLAPESCLPGLGSAPSARPFG
jgi:hypothetical protein